MVLLKEKEICPKSADCKFAKAEGETCLGCTERNSTFVCDLDFLLDDYQEEPMPFLACSL